MEEIYKWSNIMEHYKLFPTHLFVFDDFYKDSVAEMKKYISVYWTDFMITLQINKIL